ncbi:MAG: hypothetical protein PCFJNLEI_00981 [Verrucomicrobiae bacterium]|nr:hypothetical protein [Verrucomicrobiae bacterium]
MRLEVFALTALLIGCATVPPPTPVRVSTDAFLTQRGVLTIRGRQFPLTGYLALSEHDGIRLIMTHTLGQVLADVLIKPDGAMHVMRPSPVLRREWIERFVAADLRRFAESGTLTFRDRHHTLELRTVETKPGPQPASLFEVPR